MGTTAVTRTEFNSLKGDVAEIKAMLLAMQPAKAPVKAPAKKPAAKKATTKAAKCLTRKNRAEFVKAHPWAKGLSTSVIAFMAVEEPHLVKAGWKIGERRTAMIMGD